MSALARKLGTTALVLALLALAPGWASAAEIHTSVSPTVLTGHGPWQVTYKLEFAAGALPEQLLLHVSTTGVFPPTAVVTGPGSAISLGKQIVMALRTCPGVARSFGPDGAGQEYWAISLPAATATTLSFSVTRNWPFSVDEPGFGVISFATAAQPADFQQLHGSPVGLPYTPLQVDSPAIRARRQVPLNVRLGGGLVGAGQRVPISGTTTPKLAGQRVTLRAAFRPNGAQLNPSAALTIPIARVRVDRRGSFRYADWRPSKPGHYSVAAVYHSRDPRFRFSTTGGCLPTVGVTG